VRVRPTPVFSVLALLVAGACASGGGGEMEEPIDPNAPRVCIDIDNRQGGGIMERIFLIGINSGQRLRIGDAPVGRVTRFCTQSAVIPGAHYLLIERPSSDNIDPALNQNQARAQRTTDFVLEAGDLWTWDVRRDRFTCTPNGAMGGDC
jgi:hypothetical protein